MSHPVHKHFEYDALTNKSVCNYCKEPKCGKHASNLLRHLKSRHKKFYLELLPETIGFSKIKEDRAKKDITVTFNLDDLIKCFVSLVTIDGRPYSCIEDKGICGILQPIFKACDQSGISFRINRRNISEYCNEYENKMIERIRFEVKDKVICIEMDIVTVLDR